MFAIVAAIWLMTGELTATQVMLAQVAVMLATALFLFAILRRRLKRAVEPTPPTYETRVITSYSIHYTKLYEIATTGYTGRELYSCSDKSNQLYMVGSMGCASSLGLGLALARPSHRVIVIDGDGRNNFV